MIMLALAALLACGDKDDNGSDTGDAGSDDGAADGGASGSGVAPLADLSSGECPDLDASGTSTFLSYGIERTATILIPDPLPEGPMPVVYFFHGLMDPGSTPQPTEYMASALGLQDLADDEGVVVILPESPTQELLNIQFFLWDIQEDSAADLALYDDLRTCVAEQLDVDLDRFIAWGFSGGALFNTVVLSQRADTLAAAIEMSGGSDVDAYIYDDLIARYQTPAWPLPVLLQSGGANDVWPNTSLVIVDFQSATDTLEGQLAADGSVVVRCSHNSGHTVTNKGLDLAIEWALGHSFGQPSPWASDGLGSDDDWCVLHQPE